MCDVRKSVVRVVLTGLAVGLLAAAMGEAKAQAPVRRETNAGRQARLARTIKETYTHQWEIFGGGGYLRFRPGDQLQKDNQITWSTQANYFLNPKLAIIGQIGGEFGHAQAQRPYDYAQASNPQINEYTFMGGAGYRLYASEKTAVTPLALFGVGWGIFSGGSKDIAATQLGLYPDGFRPAFSVGVNLDYNFYPNLAFRVTPAYLGTTFGGSLQNNAGFNAGLVYRFGRQK